MWRENKSNIKYNSGRNRNRSHDHNRNNNPFKAAVPFGGQTNEILINLSPKQDFCPKTRTAIPFWGQTSRIILLVLGINGSSSEQFPPKKRDCSPKRVKHKAIHSTVKDAPKLSEACLSLHTPQKTKL